MSVDAKDTETLTRPTSKTSGGGSTPASDSCFHSIDAKKWFSVSILLLVIVFVLIAVLIFVAGEKKKDTAAEGVTGEPSYSFCDTLPECVSDVNEFADEINHTDNFYGPACVANNMMGRVIIIPGNNTAFQPTKVRPWGRFAFAIGPEMLARILVIGRYRATNIVQELGYGDSYVCGTAANNYTDCQYRLLVWSVPCPPTEPPLIQAFWDNLEEFYRTRVYFDQTPDLSDALTTIKAAGGQLQAFTGCDPQLLNTNGQYYNTTIQQLAGCSKEFMDAMSLFSKYPPCNGTDKNNPKYTKDGGCYPEDQFLAIPKPTAAQLRAYLMQQEGFNPLYTGYGFTSNTDYYDPLQQEYWYENEYITTLTQATVITFYNGTALGLGV